MSDPIRHLHKNISLALAGLAGLFILILFANAIHIVPVPLTHHEIIEISTIIGIELALLFINQFIVLPVRQSKFQSSDPVIPSKQRHVVTTDIGLVTYECMDDQDTDAIENKIKHLASDHPLIDFKTYQTELRVKIIRVDKKPKPSTPEPPSNTRYIDI